MGTIDRIDAVSSTGEPTPLVIDYKNVDDLRRVLTPNGIHRALRDLRLEMTP